MTDPSRRRITGSAVALHGNDIDTDRIIPARYLKGTGFAGLERHAFADERQAARERGATHPFDDPRHRQACILVVNQNFGCGSSREHAPQALWRAGITAVVGESFAEIFAGNCVAIGVPCLRVSQDDARRLQEAAEADAARVFSVDLEEKTIRSGNLVVPFNLPDGARLQLIHGTWDAASTLLAAGPEIERTASRLPYARGWTATSAPDQPASDSAARR